MRVDCRDVGAERGDGDFIPPRTLSPGKPRHAVPRTRRSFHFRGIVMVWNANRVKEVGESLSFPEW